jgi:CelD/BcsL family acetyltransferase involved in cellulose biosynthesis
MRQRGRHEARSLASVHIRAYELGRIGRPVLLRYRKERRVVEEQVLTHSQNVAAAKASAYEVEVIRDIDRFNSIAHEWDRLVDEWGSDRVFLSHTWFRTWWEAFGKGRELFVVTVRSNRRLVAAAPMMRTLASVCRLKAPTLHAIYNPHTPRYDLIVGNNQDPRLYEVIWKTLIDRSNCELIVLAQVPMQSHTILAMEKLAKHDGWLTGQWISPAAPYIPLGCEYSTFFQTLRSSSRFSLTKRHTRLNKVEPVEVEIVTRPDKVEEAMRDGLRIEAAGWKGHRGTAMLSDPTVADFYVRLAKREAELGQLRLTFLRAGGKRVSFNYLLESGKKLYAVKIGYDPQYHAYSPGNMLLNLILKDACERGVEEYDLLGGDDEWKFEWTKEKREHRWLFLFRNGLRGRALHSLKFGVVPAVKRYMRNRPGS